MTTALDPFIPSPDVRERHEIMIRAPATVVFEAAKSLELGSIPIVTAMFWLRAKAMGAKGDATKMGTRGFVEDMHAIGWGTLFEEPGRVFVAGAVCQPWLANVVFTAIPADHFASDARPDAVKIAWTLEAEPLGPSLTRFVTETRVLATDAGAKRKFMRYWSVARFGIVFIRWVMLPAIQRDAERFARALRAS